MIFAPSLFRIRLSGSNGGATVVYALSVIHPYETDIGCTIFDDPRKDPLFKMEYSDPDQLDWRARGLISRPIQMLQGYAVVESGAPKKLHWSGGKRAIPDVLALASVMIVCDRFRAFVEELERKTHQFIPVDIYRSKKAESAARYYWFNICTRLESVDPDHTTFYRMPSHEGTFAWTNMRPENGDYVEIPGAKAVFSRHAIGGHCFWRDKYLTGLPHGLCADGVGAAAIAENFSGLVLTRHDEI
jgi:hypothetical protein